MASWLQKRSPNNRKDWKRRWFSMKGNKIYYYENPSTTSSPFGFIDMEKIQSVTLSPKVQNGFEIATPGRVYYLKAGMCLLSIVWHNKTISVKKTPMMSKHG
jgi:hypothetical protein